MGIFSKKNVTCDRCGKEYQTRNTRGEHICDECLEKEIALKNSIRGYIEYADKMYWMPYSITQMVDIVGHRAKILEKYRMKSGISRSELQEASNNYKKLTDAEAADIINRFSNSSVNVTIGAAYTGNFFVPTGFDSTIIDAEDVFAVGYTSVHNLQSTDDKDELILCIIFTNDPYIPVFPMIYGGKLGFFEIVKSKKGRQGISALFETICPNLTYPVQDIKQLKKQIKTDENIRGNIKKDAMLNYLSNASLETGIFNATTMQGVLSMYSSSMLDEYGYIQEAEINTILRLDKMFNRKFWQKQIKRLANYDIGEE